MFVTERYLCSLLTSVYSAAYLWQMHVNFYFYDYYHRPHHQRGEQESGVIREC